ncbi:hypothetical protein GUJ93_ZPchr0003g18622 [Zizania palustris]|uniref:Uncharacterized protein n=1 Tax=Zizania palustris TaxID=103762 RepID=A0A8J5SRD9_ZIZPA|nr:hypothetical protein GUJ93_ZPchr0003g18622 [Zizania palustris]
MAAAMDVDGAAAGGERPSEKELFQAAETGDAAAFSTLAPADLAAALSLRNEDGRSLLHVAAAFGHAKVVTALAAVGGDAVTSVVNGQDEEGWAPIHSTASSGNSEIISILLDQGTRSYHCISVRCAICAASFTVFGGHSFRYVRKLV